MGCAASKPMLLHAAMNDWYPPVARSITIPSHAQDHMQDVDDFQIVPLSASKYGIMKVEAPNDTLEDLKDLVHGDSMREALKRLENLDLGPDSGPQSWLEANSMLEDLKPGLERYFSEAGGLMEVIQPGSGKKFTADTSSEVDDGAEAVSNEDAAYFKGEKVSKKGTSSPLQGRDQHGRGGKENTKPQSFKGARSLSKLFSFGANSKRGSKFARDGKTDADVVACKSNLSENCANSSSEPRSSLFDADFLASYEDALKKLNFDDLESLQPHALGANSITSKDSYETQALDEYTEWKNSDGRISEAQALMKSSVVDHTSKPTSVPKRTVKKVDPLEKFDKTCPPGGEKAVVLYTTSLRGVRKTFEDCSNVRTVLQSFCVTIDERDIAMHQEFRNELREMMGSKPVPAPRLFIKGRYIGGAEEALQLHEEGQLLELFEGIPKDEGNGRVCDGCGGVRFVPCLECSGSCKLVDDEEEVIRCPHCNENGLIQCPICFC